MEALVLKLKVSLNLVLNFSFKTKSFSSCIKIIYKLNNKN